MEIEEHLFRHEAARLVAILTGLFGMNNLALAEDVVQDAFCHALESWKFRGPPDDPTAWLMAVAKRRAVDVLRKEATARRFAPEVGRLFESEWTLWPVVEQAFDAGGITDVQLRMMFSCVHPKLTEEARLGLILHLLCGFGMDETAAAFLKRPGAMEKKLVRAKRTLAASPELFDFAGADDVARRLPSVLHALYLLFNEGYHGASRETAVRAELCDEAIRLVGMLLENPLTATPRTHALAALFHFDAARLPARIDADGDFVPLVDQDRGRWDRAHIDEGNRLLEISAAGSELTVYHVEAAIAGIHASARSIADTDWAAVVSLYDMLMRIAPSPVVALNRAIALAQRDGPERGLHELNRIERREKLERYPFAFVARAECELRLGRFDDARKSFEAALDLARNAMERRFVSRRLQACRAEQGSAEARAEPRSSRNRRSSAPS